MHGFSDPSGRTAPDRWPSAGLRRDRCGAAAASGEKAGRSCRSGTAPCHRLDAPQVSDALVYVTSVIGEATELFHNPDRPHGWVIRDPATLQARGQSSRQNIRSIIALAADRPKLASSLTGRLLDVGTGVGGMALEAAERCPRLRVVGLDIWEPSLALARANVVASPHAARIEIRAQDVTQLDSPRIPWRGCLLRSWRGL